MHLQQRHDALTPDCAHPEFGMPRSVALNLGVERGVDANLLQLLVKPGVLWVANAPLCLIVRAGSGALAVDPGCPTIPVPTSAVVEHGIAKPLGFALDCVGKPQ